MTKEFSPEEKLLNLIKRKKKDDTPSQPEADDAPQATQKPAIPPKRPALSREKESGVSPALFAFDNIAKLEHIRIVNVVLFTMLIVVILYFLVDIFLIPPKQIAVLKDEEARTPKTIKEIELEPFSYYSKAFSRKDVFKPLMKDQMKKAAPEIPPEEIIGSLALLGIVTGEIPQAIIEDKKQKRRFFLKEGQSSGGVFLKKIEDGTVTVVYKGEEFNISL
ncbi:hypothetical protein OAA99_00105 [Omnitrophica bacterium]|nr:hypothetical protein [Candidatus Omnitrophota bacterium]